MLHQQLYLTGIIQGVGFRPFIYRLATDLNLKGWVQNSTAGVTIALEGEAETIAIFCERLALEKPPLSEFKIVERQEKPLALFRDFQILPSAATTRKQAIVLPDLATCPACLQEIFDPQNRRYQYPFTNCTYCGPRHSILLSLPYDRSHTTMKQFQMCADCQTEYENPRDRRFHAQPNACPKCGPQLSFYRSSLLETNLRSDPVQANPVQANLEAKEPLKLAVEAIVAGEIVAIKGIGGFHLVCDATNEKAVQTLRDRKQRPHKPFALMVKDLATAQHYCHLSPVAAKLLTSPQAPIVLSPRILPSLVFNPNSEEQTLAPIAPNVAPGNPDLGVMLPYSPLHHLLLQALPLPIVATSGNRSDEPICIDNSEALDRLSSIADAFLLHDRPIVRPLDDSIVRVIDDQAMLLRRSRGYAPLPLSFPLPLPQTRDQTILAVGGHLKNTIAFSHNHQIFISPHIGDLDSVETLQRFEITIAQSLQLYDLTPAIIVRDAHPDYASSQFAERWCGEQTAIDSNAAANSRPRPVSIQHHQAHLLACWGEDPVWEPALGVIWDGTGYGTDGTIWGGEFFELRPCCEGLQAVQSLQNLQSLKNFQNLEIRRVAHLRPFPLLGGDRAAREPRRSALGLLYAAWGDELWNWTHLAPLHSCTTQEQKIFQKMLQNQLNVPATSSMGRLFDGVAALLGLWQSIRFEGQAAQALEALVPDRFSFANPDRQILKQAYSFPLLPPAIGSEPAPWQLDWQPLIQGILLDLEQGRSPVEIATRFHYALIEAIVSVAQTLGHTHLFLSGGCFQNVALLTGTIAQLRRAGFTPHWPHQVPPNDGGIAFGQAIGAITMPSANLFRSPCKAELQ